MVNENTRFDVKARGLYENYNILWAYDEVAGLIQRGYRAGWRPWSNIKKKERDYWRGLAQLAIADA